MSFADKTIIVTGATSRVGRATAEAFGRSKAAIVLVGRNEGVLNEVAAEVRGHGGRAVACPADITAAGAAEQIVGAAVEMSGTVDVLVNAAGVIASGKLEATTDEVWNTMMAVNVTEIGRASCRERG